MHQKAARWSIARAGNCYKSGNLSNGVYKWIRMQAYGYRVFARAWPLPSTLLGLPRRITPLDVSGRPRCGQLLDAPAAESLCVRCAPPGRCVFPAGGRVCWLTGRRAHGTGAAGVGWCRLRHQHPPPRSGSVGVLGLLAGGGGGVGVGGVDDELFGVAGGVAQADQMGEVGGAGGVGAPPGVLAELGFDGGAYLRPQQDAVPGGGRLGAVPVPGR